MPIFSFSRPLTRAIFVIDMSILKVHFAVRLLHLTSYLYLVVLFHQLFNFPRFSVKSFTVSFAVFPSSFSFVNQTL